MLKETYIALLTKYTENQSQVTELWSEIQKHYSGKSRHYHKLQHLENLLLQLTGVQAEIDDWDAVLFALYYHDVIYNTLKSDNEEKSAVLAVKRMAQCQIPESMIARCQSHILATKQHTNNTDNDTNYFTDADLSVLGQDWETYATYYKNIRKEYAIYPDLVYNPGRKKVLEHFLAMPRIFKTLTFFDRFETQAKANLQREFDLLG